MTDTDAAVSRARDAVRNCRCGHSFEAHDGHTISIGEPGRFHCSQGDGCRIYRPNEAALDAYGELREAVGAWTAREQDGCRFLCREWDEDETRDNTDHWCRLCPKCRAYRCVTCMAWDKAQARLDAALKVYNQESQDSWSRLSIHRSLYLPCLISIPLPLKNASGSNDPREEHHERAHTGGDRAVGTWSQLAHTAA